MLAQTRRVAGALFTVVVLLTMTAWGCDKLPLLAPNGTVITIFPSSMVVPLNGSIDITAVAIEAGSGGQTPTPTPPPTPPTTPGTPGTPTTPTTPTPTPGTPGTGTPVHNGTVISFTTTVGRIEPNEAPTRNGQVSVRLLSAGQSGVATITAFSGGARSNQVTVNIGAAAVGRIDVVANPAAVPPGGGSSQLAARVFDSNGNPLAGVPVSFSIMTGSGSFSPATPTSDSNGVAQTTFTTNVESVVVATAGGGGGGTAPPTANVTIRVNAAFTLVIAPPTTAPVENQPATFTVTPGGGAGGAAPIVNNVVVSFGDGSVQPVGTISGTTTISHVYTSSGTFQVTANGTDINGAPVSAGTLVAVTEQLPLAVTLNASPSTARRGVDVVTFTASVSGGSPIRFIWNFGDGTTLETTGPIATHTYAATTPTGPLTVSVRVLSNNAGEGLGQTTVVITTP
jgi:Bacterial Ig-like domain (group 1)/PKD domain